MFDLQVEGWINFIRVKKSSSTKHGNEESSSSKPCNNVEASLCLMAIHKKHEVSEDETGFLPTCKQ